MKAFAPSKPIHFRMSGAVYIKRPYRSMASQAESMPARQWRHLLGGGIQWGDGTALVNTDVLRCCLALHKLSESSALLA